LSNISIAIGPLEAHIASAYDPKNKYTKLLEVWTRRWNPGTGETPKVGMMHEQILQRGDYGEEFKRDFVLYVYYQTYESGIFLHYIEFIGGI